MPTTNDILGIIMGGGRGSHLHPLTKLYSKPAVPIAGKYRLIEIPISNTYQFDSYHTGWVQILAAEQTMESAGCQDKYKLPLVAPLWEN